LGARDADAIAAVGRVEVCTRVEVVVVGNTSGGLETLET